MATQAQTKTQIVGPIVMVDDEADLVRSTVEMLRREFAPTRVIGTSDPREAKRWLEEERPSVLITDIRMPHINGLELIIFAQKQWSAIPIIAITAFPSAEVTAHSRFSGFSYLQKPVAFRTLRDIIANLSEVPVAAFRGAVSTTTLADVVQLYALSSQTGLISVSYNEQVGEIWLDQGRVVHSETGGWLGNNAFYKIMAWPHGNFSWLPGRPKQNTVEDSLTELLLEAYRLKDELAQWLRAAEDAPQRSEEPASDPPLESGGRGVSSLLEDPEAHLAALAREKGIPKTTARPAAEPASDIVDDEEIIWIEDSSAGEQDTGKNKEKKMALTANNIKESLSRLEGIDGFIGAALADSDSGMCLGALGGGGVLNLEVAAASNSEVVRSKKKAMKTLSLRDEIEDILISLGKQYHIIRPLKSRPSVFFYIALDRSRANLAMARYALAEVERELVL